MPLYFLKLYNLTPPPPTPHIEKYCIWIFLIKFSFQLNQVSYEKTVDVNFFIPEYKTIYQLFLHLL